ncbi:MAG: DUF6320 domain-containing protein [Clostridiales bacterium]|nr:DUF6320 domain-containing protein [Clostridiales bacterium]
MRCYNCGVEVRGRVNVCPLCHNKLEEEENPGEDVFPVFPKGRTEKKISFNRVFWFVFFNAVSICVAVNIIFETQFWSMIVAAGLIYVYVLIKNTILSRTEISKKFFFQTIVLSTIFIAIWLAFFKQDGYNMSWVFEYVLPILYAVSALAYGILIFFRVHNFNDYIIYELFIIILGVMPLVLFFCGVIKLGIPALICFFVCLFVFLSNLIFSWKFVINELKRRFHA